MTNDISQSGVPAIEGPQTIQSTLEQINNRLDDLARSFAGFCTNANNLQHQAEQINQRIERDRANADEFRITVLENQAYQHQF